MTPDAAAELTGVSRSMLAQIEKGDSMRFAANVPHAYRNAGRETAELSMLIFYHR